VSTLVISRVRLALGRSCQLLKPGPSNGLFFGGSSSEICWRVCLSKLQRVRSIYIWRRAVLVRRYSGPVFAPSHGCPPVRSGAAGTTPTGSGRCVAAGVRRLAASGSRRAGARAVQRAPWLLLWPLALAAVLAAALALGGLDTSNLRARCTSQIGEQAGACAPAWRHEGVFVKRIAHQEVNGG